MRKKLVGILWIVAILLLISNGILYNAAMGKLIFDFKWYNNILLWRYRQLAFYICASLNLIPFSILVMIYHKKEKYSQMMIALMGFVVLIFLLALKIKI